MLQLEDAEMNAAEAFIIRDYCRSFLMITHCQFLKVKFPDICFVYGCGELPEEIPDYPPPP